MCCCLRNHYQIRLLCLIGNNSIDFQLNFKEGAMLLVGISTWELFKESLFQAGTKQPSFWRLCRRCVHLRGAIFIKIFQGQDKVPLACLLFAQLFSKEQEPCPFKMQVHLIRLFFSARCCFFSQVESFVLMISG